MYVSHLFLIIAFLSLSALYVADDTRDYYDGLWLAEEQEKPILLVFTGYTCQNNEHVNDLLHSDTAITPLLDKYVVITLYVDDSTELDEEKIVERDGRKITLRTKGNEWAHLEISKFDSRIQPLISIIDADEQILKKPIEGKISEAELLSYLQ